MFVFAMFSGMVNKSLSTPGLKFLPQKSSMKKVQSSARLTTFKLLRDRPASIKLKDVAEGSGLPLSWINLFNVKGDKCSSSIDKVEQLYRYFTGKGFV